MKVMNLHMKKLGMQQELVYKFSHWIIYVSQKLTLCGKMCDSADDGSEHWYISVLPQCLDNLSHGESLLQRMVN